jgi:sugar lactone lactonase YvrE
VAGNGYVNGNGFGGYSGDGGAATNAELNFPSCVAVDAISNLFIADSSNNLIRKVDNKGIITTFAGTGGIAFSGDGGAATNAQFHYLGGLAVDAIGNLFIADTSNYRIRKVGTNGIIITVAGGGTSGLGDGGAATNAELNFPSRVAVDAISNLFIADSNLIRKVDNKGIITTFAGTGGIAFSGDGGAATNAQFHLYYLGGLAVDATGNLFIADTYNYRIRKVGTNGIITTVAGGGTSGLGDGGAATNAELNFPSGVAVDAIGNLFIVDDYVIRKVDNKGIITTVAGNGTNGYSGDGGVATNAELNNPTDVAVDTTGKLFIADSHNFRIRVVNPGTPCPTQVLSTVGFGNAGAYDVVVSSPYGSVTSSVVHLTITLPPVVLSAPQVTGGRTNFTFVLSGPAGSNCVVQVSTNLLNWSSVSTSAIPASGSITLTNAISGYNRRFYRAYLK